MDALLARLDALTEMGVDNLAGVRVTLFEARERAQTVIGRVDAALQSEAETAVALGGEVESLWSDGQVEGLFEATRSVEIAEEDLRLAQTERIDRLTTLAEGTAISLGRALTSVDEHHAQVAGEPLRESRRIVEAANTINSGALRELVAVRAQPDLNTRLRTLDGIEDSMRLFSERLRESARQIDSTVNDYQEELGRQEAAFDYEAGQLQNRIERSRDHFGTLVRSSEFVRAGGPSAAVTTAFDALDAANGILIGTAEQLDALRLSEDALGRRNELLAAIRQSVSDLEHREAANVAIADRAVLDRTAEVARQESDRVSNANRAALVPALAALQQNMAAVNGQVATLRAALVMARESGLTLEAGHDFSIQEELANAVARRNGEHYLFSSELRYDHLLSTLTDEFDSRQDALGDDAGRLQAAIVSVETATQAAVAEQRAAEPAQPAPPPLSAEVAVAAGNMAEELRSLTRLGDQNRNRLAAYVTRVDQFRAGAGADALTEQRDMVTSAQAANEEAMRRLEGLLRLPDVAALDAEMELVRGLLSFYTPAMSTAMRQVDESLSQQREQSRAAAATLLAGRGATLPAVGSVQARTTARIPSSVPPPALTAGVNNEVERLLTRIAEVRDRAQGVLDAMDGFEAGRRHFHTPKQKGAVTDYLAELVSVQARVNAAQAAGAGAVLAGELGSAGITLASFKLPSVEEIEKASKERIRRFPLMADSLARQIQTVQKLFANVQVPEVPVADSVPVAPAAVVVAAPVEVAVPLVVPPVQAPAAVAPVEAAPVPAPVPVEAVAPAAVEAPVAVVAPEVIEEAAAPAVAPVEASNIIPVAAVADGTLARDVELERLGTDASTTRDRVAAPKRELTEDERNFRYARDESLAPSGRVSRIRANLAAIKLVKTLESENRNANADEKAVLAAYAGWGADKEVFNDGQAYYRKTTGAAYSYNYQPPSYTGWEKEYGKHYDSLKGMLTEEEWKLASASVLNAHYTSTELCHGLWDIARRAGFRGGRVLEPAIGSGRIIGAMPEDLAARSEITGVELDSLTARMAAKLYPEATIYQDAFQDAGRSSLPNHFYDLVVSNVPFSDVAPAGQDTDFGGDEPKYNLHNYFIRRSMDKLKPGGIAIFITSASSLQNNQRQRDELAKHMQLLGGIRLPSDAFQSSANTEVVTDVIVVRKADTEKVDHHDFTKLVAVGLEARNSYKPSYGNGEDEKFKRASVNEYFANNPAMVLGEHSLNGQMYGGGKEDGQYTVVTPRGADPLTERFAAAVELLPEEVPNPSLTAFNRSQGVLREELDPEQREITRLRVRLGLKPGTFAAPDLDQLAPGEQQPLKVGMVGTGGILLPPPWRNSDGTAKDGYKHARGFNADRADELTLDYVGVRTAMRNVIATDLNPAASPADSQQAHDNLKNGYEGFVAKWGTFNFNQAVNNLLSLDPEIGTALALERVRIEKMEKNGKIMDKPVVTPAPIITERTLYPVATPTNAETVEDAVNISLGQLGRVDSEYAARLLGKENDADGVRRLIVNRGLAFENPRNGLLEGRVEYLSGNVVLKLREARKAQVQSQEAEAGVQTTNYTANIAALEAVQPARILFEQIVCDLGSTWVPNSTVSRFAGEVFEQSGPVQCGFNPHISQWLVSERVSNTTAVISGYGTPKCNGIKVLDAALNRKHIKITMEVMRGESKARVLDEEATNAANARADALRDKWREWVKDDPEAQAEIEEAYNQSFNNVVLAEYKGDYLTFPGLAQGPNCMTPRDHQRDVVARLLTEQSGMAAHGVGFGKTFELILAAMESKRTGLARKPMIICDNASYPQFVQTVRETYPQAAILAATEDNMSPRNRQTFMSHMATGNWDVILCAHQHLTMMPMRPETELAYRNEKVTSLKRAHETMKDMEVSHNTVRNTQKQIERDEAKIKELMEKLKANQDSAICFEDTGVDLMEVDEAHKFKKMPFETSMSDVKGVDTQSSQRGLSLLLKARHIQRLRGDGKGVITATGTPCTNTMAEIWNQIRLCKPTMNEAFNVPSFDAFCASFTRMVTALELNESNGRWRYATRLAKFVNGPQFVQYVRSALDVKMDHANVKLDIPALVGGQIEKVIVPLTDCVADIQDQMASVYDTWDNLQGQEKRETSYVPLVLMGASMTAAVDPRLIDPSSQDDPESLLNALVKNVAAIYNDPEVAKDREGNVVANPAQVIFCDRYSVMSTDSLNAIAEGRFKSAITIDADALVAEKGSDSDDEDEEQSFKDEPAPPASATSRFNLYHDMRDKLLASGVKASHIAIASDFTSSTARKALFERVNKGEVRIVIGSTALLGVGVNIQERLYAAHHVDPPRSMTPADLTQRNGRILRQGNLCAEIRDIYYGMQDTATPGIMDRIARKEVFTTQCLSGKGVGTEFEDCGQVDTSQMKGMLVSDKRTMKREELRAAIVEQKVKRETMQNRTRDLRTEVRHQEERVEWLTDKTLPREIALAEFFERIVAPQEGVPVTWRYTKGEKEMDGQENEEYEECKKQLNDLIGEWKKLKFGDSVVSEAMGAMTINGVKMRITREQEGSELFSKSKEGEAKFVLKAEVLNPLGGNSLNTFKFSTAAALLNIVSNERATRLADPGVTRGWIEQAKKTAAKVGDLLSKAPVYDDTPIRELDKELAILEADMAKNPHKRLRRADRERVAAEAAQEMILNLPPPDEAVNETVEVAPETGGVRFRVIDGGVMRGAILPEEEYDRELVVEAAVV